MNTLYSIAFLDTDINYDCITQKNIFQLKPVRPEISTLNKTNSLNL